MHARHVLASVVALAGATHALAVRNKHVADFRLFGEQGCFRLNQGIWTVIDDDFRPGECKTLGGSLPRSIRNVDMNGGVILHRRCLHGGRQERVRSRRMLQQRTGLESVVHEVLSAWLGSLMVA
ncbi:hypothetical protein E4U53_004748 [Claviceps sorghi]|nr:hypothetical protein E4U53_004748 [Claviceps sorghi]